MPGEPPSELNLEMVAELVRQSEIDFRTLRAHVRALLERQSQASIGELLEAFPAEQGLGSVVGYVTLGARHGEVSGALTGKSEQVSWQGADSQARRALIPAIYFIKERYVELVD